MLGKGNEWFVKNAKVYTCLKNEEWCMYTWLYRSTLQFKLGVLIWQHNTFCLYYLIGFNANGKKTCHEGRLLFLIDCFNKQVIWRKCLTGFQRTWVWILTGTNFCQILFFVRTNTRLTDSLSLRWMKKLIKPL